MASDDAGLSGTIALYPTLIAVDPDARRGGPYPTPTGVPVGIKQPLIKNASKCKGHGFGCKGQQLDNQDARSQSLPDCLDENGSKVNFLDFREDTAYCDTDNTPPNSPTNDVWFKTWPERCDKLKSSDSNANTCVKDVPNSCTNTPVKPNNSDLGANKINNKVTLHEALQSISLAYSPVTKQLHLVEQSVDIIANDRPNFDTDRNSYSGNDLDKLSSAKKIGHRRNEAGSFSSTISTVSTLSGITDSSPSGSLLDSDERSSRSFDITDEKSGKKSIANFFTKNVFSWKSGTNDATNHNGMWKLFGKHTNNCLSNSPIRVVASSSALIQHGRPSTLPAKTLEEEIRHREEYKAMIAAAKKKEAKNTVAKQKQQKLQLRLEEQQATSTKYFMQQVLPNWETMRTNKRTQELWWQGLPSSVRGKVWRLAIGNELNVTPQLYEICVCRAQNRLNNFEPSKCGSNIDPESSMDVIQLDISRTFPHLCIFQEGGPYSETLHSLLAAYVCYRPDVGYVQGMSYIAAILILNMEHFDAFICFANLLNQPLHLSAFTLDQTQMQAYYNAYNEVFKFNLPKLYSHFEKSGLTPDLYLLDWIYTIFAKAMPLDIACRIWDIFLRDGYEFIFRTAL
ncbi:hypothetical protein NQ315_005967, partial [Exocentrus adspersus]